MDFGRLITAMATPFDAAGNVDEDGLARLTEHLISTGTTSLAVCGTTGESPTLSHEEKVRLFQRVTAFANGRVPVIAGTGSNSTKASIELSKEAEALGVQGLLLVTPYYNRPTQDGLYAHFCAIAEAVKLPIILYNIPSRSAINLNVDTILRLANVPNIIAVKEASGNMAQILQIAAEKPDDFYLYSGDDKFTLPILSVGGYGVISVASHVAAPEISAMIESYLSGDVKGAATWAGRLLPLFEAMFRTSNPAPLKAALRLLGLPAGQVRLPLVDAPESVESELRRELVRLKKL